MLIWLTVLATVFLFIYLGAALMRPNGSDTNRKPPER